MKCRHCGSELQLPFLDLGNAPPSNAYLTEEAVRAPETWFPLRILVCETCWLVQTEDHAGRVRRVSTSVTVDIEGIPGGDYELLDDAPLDGDEPL